jgi:hypothetical protein
MSSACFPAGSGGGAQRTDDKKVTGARSAAGLKIRLGASHPEWAVGFADEVWWSRLARPRPQDARREGYRLTFSGCDCYYAKTFVELSLPGDLGRKPEGHGWMARQLATMGC